MDDSRGTIVQGLVALAALVVIVAGLKASSDILLPILFSAFLSILGVPLVRGLTKAGLPRFVAIPVVVLCITAGLVAVTGIVAQTVRGFAAEIGTYNESFNQLVRESVLLGERFGIELEVGMFSGMLQPSVMMTVLTESLNTVVGVLSRVLIVIVTLTFILFESTELEDKFKAAFGTEAMPAGPFTNATGQVQRYLVIKSIASAFTGLFIAAGCTIIGLDFPIMWGVIAFLFNYIPSIGSIVAAIPSILLAVVQLGPEWAIGVLLLYLAVNVTIGNFLEPRVMGRSLGLSPLVVFLSLLFWGWVWGPVGMLFCVPMTVIAKLFLEQYEESRWIAVFLGSPREILEVRATQLPAQPRNRVPKA